MLSPSLHVMTYIDYSVSCIDRRSYHLDSSTFILFPAKLQKKANPRKNEFALIKKRYHKNFKTSKTFDTLQMSVIRVIRDLLEVLKVSRQTQTPQYIG